MNGKPLEMELDTGVAVSIKEIVDKKFPGATVHPSTVLLKTYTREILNVLGQLSVEVQYGDQGP